MRNEKFLFGKIILRRNGFSGGRTIIAVERKVFYNSRILFNENLFHTRLYRDNLWKI